MATGTVDAHRLNLFTELSKSSLNLNHLLIEIANILLHLLWAFNCFESNYSTERYSLNNNAVSTGERL